MNAVEILGALVAFPTVSRDSNLPLLDWVEALLAPVSPRIRRFPSPDGTKANLLVSFGPDVPRGLVLSGHTDVVPVDGQAWLADPWTLREENGRLIGRGACDMKGFVACFLALAPQWAAQPLARDGRCTWPCPMTRKSAAPASAPWRSGSARISPLPWR